MWLRRCCGDRLCARSAQSVDFQQGRDQRCHCMGVVDRLGEQGFELVEPRLGRVAGSKSRRVHELPDGRVQRRIAVIGRGLLSDVPMLEFALDYARRGWPVFPCKPTNKAPFFAGGFHVATTDEETIRKMVGLLAKKR